MKIAKKDALMWFRFFAQLPDDEELMPKQMELVYATFAQIESAIDARNEKLLAEILAELRKENKKGFKKRIANTKKNVYIKNKKGKKKKIENRK